MPAAVRASDHSVDPTPESVTTMAESTTERSSPPAVGPGATPAAARGSAAKAAAVFAPLILLIAPAAPASAQENLPGRLADSDADSVQLLDRVAAVVGDTAILVSEVQQELIRQEAQGRSLPRRDPVAMDSIARATLDRMIDETLLLERAKQEGVQVNEQDVDAAVQEQFNRIRSNFQSDEVFRQAVENSGMNMFQFRQMWRRQIRADLMRRRFQQQLLSSNALPAATVTDQEVRRYFEQNQASASRPATLSFQRITVAPEPSRGARDSALAEIQTALSELREGTEFEVVARRYSDDPGSRDRGGELGWIRRSDVVPAFAELAWSAPPGRPVGPVETRFGFHVVEVMNTRGGERQIRHVLVRPEITDQDVRDARDLAEALRDSLQAGADPARLARDHGLPGEQLEFRDVRLDELAQRFGEAVREAVGSPEEGEAVGPVRREASYDLPNFVVLKITDYRSAGSYELADVRTRIRQGLLEEKRFGAYLRQLREKMYVRVLL